MGSLAPPLRVLIGQTLCWLRGGRGLEAPGLAGPTSFSVILFPSGIRGLVPLVQVNRRKEPLAEQLRTTVLLCSTASDRSDLMVTSETGSTARNGRTSGCFTVKASSCFWEGQVLLDLDLDLGSGPGVLLDCGRSLDGALAPSRVLERVQQLSDLLDSFSGFLRTAQQQVDPNMV